MTINKADPEAKKRYENTIRRFRRYHKKGWPMEKILNEETYKRVVGSAKVDKKIKLPSTGGEITESEFSSRIDQIMHILSAVASCDGKQLFGYHGKTIGWCMPEMRDKVIGYKLALGKLFYDDTERRRRTNLKATEEVADKVRLDLKNEIKLADFLKLKNSKQKIKIN